VAELYNEDFQVVAIDTNVTVAEVVLLQGLVAIAPSGTVKAAVQAAIVFNANGVASTVTFRIRKGTTTAGQLMATCALNPVTTQIGVATLAATESLSNVSGAQYCVTGQIDGGACTANPIMIDTKVLSG